MGLGKASDVRRLLTGLGGLLIVLLSGSISIHNPAAFALQDLSDHSAATTFKQASSCIAITVDGSVLLVANPDSNSVSLVDPVLNILLDEIPVGIEPRSVAVSVDQTKAFVTNRGSNSLMVIDLPARRVLSTIELGAQPAGIVVSANGQILAVAETGADQVRLLDAESLVTLKIFEVGDRPYGLAYSPDNRHILVSHLLSGGVTVLTYPPYQHYLPLIRKAPDGTIQDPSEMALTAPEQGSGMVIQTWSSVAPAPGVIINSAGTRAYLPQTMANNLGYNTTFDSSVFPKISVLDLETYQHLTSEHISLPEVDTPVGLPWDTALRNGDAELWVVNSGSNDVSVIDITDPTHPQRTAHVLVGDNPRGIVFSPDGSTANVNNTLAGTVSVIDTSLYTVSQVIPVTQIPLPPALLHGKRLFYSSAQPELSLARWISCNTCHVEGGHDGRTWLLQYLGEVPPGEEPIISRNTTSLLGMIETYPLRWSAEWDESADSEFSIRFEQFGSGLIDGDMYPTLGLPNQGRSYDLDCLALFIDGLSSPKRSHSLTLAEQRGQGIFESEETQCASCHPAPLYTDLQKHDVGTADGPGEWFGPEIDTPGLRYLFDSAPYLHDGSAASLLDVLLVKNLNDEHGITSPLDAQQLEDLIAFLLALPYIE